MMNGTFASKELSDIDRVYQRLSRYASDGERIKYCRSLIERTGNFISEQGALTEHILRNSKYLIEAASSEMENILKQKMQK